MKRVVKDILLVVFAEFVCIGVRLRWTSCGLKNVKREGGRGVYICWRRGRGGFTIVLRSPTCP